MEKLDRNKLLLHVDKRDELIFRQLIDKIEIVLNRHISQSTDFLNPYEVKIAQSIIRQFDVNYKIYGGYEGAQMQIIEIYPGYLESHGEEIKCLYFKNPNVSHRDILGAAIGAGIDRKKIGDIKLENENRYIFVKREISDFLIYNLKQISRFSVNLQEISLENLSFEEDQFEYKKYIISSLRLDTFLSAYLNISRAKANALIKSERIKLNYKIETNPSKNLEKMDLISIRQKGRVFFCGIEKNTKKGNYVVGAKIPVEAKCI